MEMQRLNDGSDRGDDVDIESQLHGDILELVLSYVPTIDLVQARRVSRSWSLAVSSSLLHFNHPRPWLVVHSQSLRPPYAMQARAFDPRSRVWLELHPQEPSMLSCPSGCSQSGQLMYSLSTLRFSFSVDPLGLSWSHVEPPLVWRADPVVAAVGHQYVIAGGGCDFDDDPLAVEIYDVKTLKWESCDAMPSSIRDCSASACLSVATGRGRVFVSEKVSGVTYSFDPKAKEWHGPYYLRTDDNIYCSVIGFAGNILLLIGLVGDPDSSHKAKAVKIWEVLGDTNTQFREIAEMPLEFLKELKGDNRSISTINVCSGGDMLYLYDPCKPETVVWCEMLEEGRDCQWGMVRVASETSDRQDRLARKEIFTCWDVGITELERASQKMRFFVNCKSKENR